MSNLDEIDLKILRQLQVDGRISYAELSSKLGIPQSTVRFRINRLVEKGIISRFVAILNPVKVGYPIVIIMLLRVHTRYMESVFNHLAKMSELHHLFQITGKYDMVVIFHAKDMDHVNEINNHVRGMEGVIDAETLLATGRLIVKTELDI